MKNSKVEICFIGNAIVDILSKISDEILHKLEVPKGSMQLVDEELSDKILKNIKNPTVISGGSAANTAVGFQSFGGKCSFMGQIGNDKFGDLFSKELNNSGVFFQDQDWQLSEKTSKSIVLVTPDAERSMNTFLGASVMFNINSVNEELITNSDMIYVEGYLFDQNDAKEAIYHCFKLAKSNNIKIAFSLSDLFCVDRHRKEFLHLIHNYVNVIFANESEIKSLYKLNLRESLNKIKNNVETGAITLGSKGSLVFENKIEHYIDPVHVEELVDTTGAGDLFASGFLYGFTNKYSIEKCGLLGNKSASEIIKYVGARPKISLKSFLN
jgi:sugar/nucleoside kinase (ribokinase family)